MAVKLSPVIYVSAEMMTIHLAAPSFELYAEEEGKVPENIPEHGL